MLEQRLPGHGENVAALKTRGILVDGSTRGPQSALGVNQRPVHQPS